MCRQRSQFIIRQLLYTIWKLESMVLSIQQCLVEKIRGQWYDCKLCLVRSTRGLQARHHLLASSLGEVSSICCDRHSPLGKVSLCWGGTLPGRPYPAIDETQRTIDDLKPILLAWKWQTQILPKRWYESTEGHRLTSQNTVVLMAVYVFTNRHSTEYLNCTHRPEGLY